MRLSDLDPLRKEQQNQDLHEVPNGGEFAHQIQNIQNESRQKRKAQELKQELATLKEKHEKSFETVA